MDLEGVFKNLILDILWEATLLLRKCRVANVAESRVAEEAKENTEELVRAEAEEAPDLEEVDTTKNIAAVTLKDALRTVVEVRDP